MSSALPLTRAHLAEGLKGVLVILKDIADGLPAPAPVVINLVQRVVTLLEGIQSNQEDAEALSSQLLQLLPVVAMALQREAVGVDGRLSIPANLRHNVERLQKVLEGIEAEVTKIVKISSSRRKRHRLTAVFWVKAHAATLQKCRDDFDWAIKLFSVTAHLDDAIRLWETSKKMDAVLTNQDIISKKAQTVVTNQFLESLPRAKYASFNCERPDKPATCLQGTRVAILKLITNWVVDPDPTTPHFFWLNGIAGIGKTTVACTIAGLMDDLGLLGGQFCFSRRGEAELRNPALVFPTIAYQLARFDPEFGRRITAVLESDPEAPYASLKQQLDRLLIKPLAEINRDPKRVVVLVLDAFDECEARGAKEILQLLISAMPSLPFFLKIFVTSRPEHHIRSVLVPANNLRVTALHDIETSTVKSDILLYLRHRLRNLGEERGIDLPLDWILESDIEILTEKAGNLFIHAATSVRFLLQGWDPREQLEHLLKIVTSQGDHGTSTTKPFADLDRLYMHILLPLCSPADDPAIGARLRLVLGSVVLFRDPLPVDALERLLSLAPGRVASTLLYLHSVVLTPPPPDDCPRAYHPSFPDFLQDRSRCPSDQLWINTDEHEGRMALHCLYILNTRLHRGLLGDLDPTLLNSEVEDLEAKIEDSIPQEVRYACRYWWSHLVGTSLRSAEIDAQLGLFASQTMLWWMEAMSWLGEVPIAVRSLEAVTSWMAKTMEPSITASLFKDGYRLLLAHNATISLSASHIARSALPFVPYETTLATQYMGYAESCIKVLCGVDSDWPACLMVWEGHSAEVNSVAYSSDGLRAASASGDRTIRLWNTANGGCLATLEGHSKDVTSISFSPNDTSLASGSDDCAVRIRDAITGEHLATLEGHSHKVTCAIFSPDGSFIASGSADSAVRIWNVTTRQPIATLRGHSAKILSVAFSSDGSNLASGSKDDIVRIWETTGRCIATFKYGLDTHHSVAFSPTKSTHMAVTSQSTVEIWDIAHRNRISLFKGHSRSVAAIAFSPNGARLASVSDDQTIRIWDTDTGERIATLRGHVAVSSVAYSPDGSRLISGGGDETVRLWDTNSSNTVVAFARHTSRITCLAFSSDGSRLLSGSMDRTAGVWDLTRRNSVMKLQGHRYAVTCVAFQQSGSYLATGAHDGEIRLWDAKTGQCSATLQTSEDDFSSLNFSSNGEYLESQQRGYPLRFWDMSGAELKDAPNARPQIKARPPVPFTVDDSRVFRTDANGLHRLVCLLPPGTLPSCIASFDLGNGMDRVAIGCYNGDVFVLEL